MNAIDTAALLAALIRSSLLAFAERAFLVHEPGQDFLRNWHHGAIARQLERCRSGEVRRLIINQPPRSLKSYLVVIAHTAWLLGLDPKLKILICCYSEDLAIQHTRAIRRIMMSEWYRNLFPGTVLADDKNSAQHFETSFGGVVRAVSVQGQITGFGYDFIVLDDPMKAQDINSEVERKKLEETYAGTISSRLNDPATGVIIVVMQRLHVYDFTTYLKEIGSWEVLSIPVVAPCNMNFDVGENRTHLFEAGAILDRRFTCEFLAEQKKTMGSANFAAQYMQQPELVSAGLLELDWFERFDTPPNFDHIILSIDPAFTENSGDWSACLVCGIRSDDLYILKALRVRLGLPALHAWIRKLDTTYNPDLIVIEAIGAGMGLASNLQESGLTHLGRIGGHRFSKVERLEMISPMIEAGRVHLPRTGEFLTPFLAELLTFPSGRNDDYVDCLTQVLGYFEKVTREAARHKRLKAPPEEPRRRSMHYQCFDV